MALYLQLVRPRGLTRVTDRIHIDDNTFLLVLTGAGVSAESGLPTFRDAKVLTNGKPAPGAVSWS